MKYLQFLLFFPLFAGAQSVQWQSKGIGGGGALFSPAISPHDHNHLYVACDMSGLYESNNYGLDWGMVHFNKIQANRSTQVQFTNNPSIMYAVNYTLQGGSDASRPVKSSDGGNSWQSINDPTNGETYTLIADINDANRLVISDYSTIWFSSDGGQSFQQKYTSNANGAGCHIAGGFFDGSTIYIGTGAGLLTSINGGNTFILSLVNGIPIDEAMVSFTGARQGNATRLFCVTQHIADVYTGISGDSYGGFLNIYTVSPGAGNWVAATNGIAAGHKPFFIRMAQNDVNTVYIAGGDDNNGVPVIYKSTNAGQQWTSVFQTNNNANITTGWSGDGGDRGWGYGELAFGFTVASDNANYAAITDYGFTHVTSTGGTSWKQTYVAENDANPAGANTPSFKRYHGNGMENTSCWNVCWGDANHLYAGYSDIKGIKSDDAGNSWNMSGSTTMNTTCYFLKHPSSNNIYAATSSVHDIYQTTYLTDARLDVGLGEITYSSNDGLTWQSLHNFNHPVVWLAIDPNNSNRMYACVIHYAGGVGEGGIWVSNNINAGAASTWTKLSNPSRTEGHPFNIHVLNDGTLMAGYCARRNGVGTFTSSSGVYILPSGSSTWIDRSDAGMMYYTKDVVIDPSDAQQSTWYACVWSGWGGAPNGLGGLYRTTNRGQSWQRIFSGADRVSSCTVNPQSATEAWITTETDGLWRTTNLNAATPSFVQDATFPFRQPERIFFNPFNNDEMWVSCFGGGLWKGDLNNTTAMESLKKRQHQLRIYPNPAKEFIYIVDAGASSRIQIIDIYGRICKSVMTEEKDAKVMVGDLSPGTYTVVVNTNEKMATGKFMRLR